MNPNQLDIRAGWLALLIVAIIMIAPRWIEAKTAPPTQDNTHEISWVYLDERPGDGVPWSPSQPVAVESYFDNRPGEGEVWSTPDNTGPMRVWGTWQPAMMKLDDQPQYPTKLAPADEAFWKWLQEGHLQYQSWQGPIYTFMPTHQWMVCAVYWENAGGIAANDNLATVETEGNARKIDNFPCSPVGACGGMQFMPDTWQSRKPFASADIQNPCDAMGGSSNLFQTSGAWAMDLSQDEYEARFRGFKGDATWNNHHGQAVATYQLSRLIYEARLRFWQSNPQ